MRVDWKHSGWRQRGDGLGKVCWDRDLVKNVVDIEHEQDGNRIQDQLGVFTRFSDKSTTVPPKRHPNRKLGNYDVEVHASLVPADSVEERAACVTV
jgi:hypothetical protein